MCQRTFCGQLLFNPLKIMIMKQKDFFVVTRIHREDLEAAGFDASNVTDEMMEEIASDMHNAHMNDIFWESLSTAAESLNIPKKE